SAAPVLWVDFGTYIDVSLCKYWVGQDTTGRPRKVQPFSCVRIMGMTQQRERETGPTVVRSTDLDMGVDELWRLVSTAEGWTGWLVDDADIDVAVGASGSASDRGIRRDIRIDHVNEGQRVDFVWWE